MEYICSEHIVQECCYSVFFDEKFRDRCRKYLNIHESVKDFGFYPKKSDIYMELFCPVISDTAMEINCKIRDIVNSREINMVRLTASIDMKSIKKIWRDSNKTALDLISICELSLSESRIYETYEAILESGVMSNKNSTLFFRIYEICSS